MAHRFEQRLGAVLHSFVYDLAKLPFLNGVVWALGEEILEPFKISPERFTDSLAELIDLVPDLCCLMTGEVFFLKCSDKLFPCCD